ncbi:MAG: primosomal protein N' [Agathobacter sp.]
MTYANVIVDISIDKLDKTFQYRIPEELEGKIEVGVQVDIPFGRRTLTGYVVELTDRPEYDETKLKPVMGIHKGSVPIESQLIALAAWMRKNYGSTMNQALKAVLPIRRKTKEIEKRSITLLCSKEEAVRTLALYEEKHYTAKARLLRELAKQQAGLDYTYAVGTLRLTAATIRSMEKEGILAVTSSTRYRNPVSHMKQQEYQLILNENQRQVTEAVIEDLREGKTDTYLLKGVTGSGKTEVYMELIAHMIAEGKQAIVLIPEIALTYQTVMRFYNRFGDRVSIMNSRLSQGERYDQYERAKAGDIDIMIGPRSALFAPFPRLGLIIIDEEHENSYKSETAPCYHARNVAIQRGKMCHAAVVLGSATPSVDSFYQAELGNYHLLELKERVHKKPLPDCEIVDMRQELKLGNRSILSERLQELMEERLKKHEQIMLFLNRRGISAFISCRSCGNVIKCPHCDVSLSQHGGGRLVCHYCGYEERMPKVCPSCGSKYLGGFKAGTQKIEMLVQKRFPQARILRMDYDTTRTKDSYENILRDFSNHEADILIGTQMIVKGHDFPEVTLVGVLAADLSLHVADFHASERTFQLLTQAVGRAGRGTKPGQAVIQTYDPEHFAVQAAANQDYEAFYRQEIAYRKLMHYPPVWNLLVVSCAGADEEETGRAAGMIANRLKTMIPSEILLVGPADASIAKINDIYRKVIYMKGEDYQALVSIKDALETFLRENKAFSHVTIQFNFNPTSGF